jgi:SulP family sulfate permease
MIMVSINTFSWKSLTALRSNPWQSSLVMLATVATVVATADLSKGVLIGVLLSGIFFAGKVARLSRIASELSDDGTIRTYFVEGRCSSPPPERSRIPSPVSKIVIDVTRAHFWDISAIGALDRVVMKARRYQRSIEIVGLNEASATLVERFAVHRRTAAVVPLD